MNKDSVAEYSGADVLDIMSLYAPNRNNFIADLIKKYLQFDKLKNNSLVLDFGAGKGEFISRFDSYKNIELLAVEADPEFIKNLSQKFKTFSSLENVPDEIDAVYLIDVLEHIENDALQLKLFYDKLKKGGRIFIYVPAAMELYSDFDKSIGHFRRYSLSELRSKVNEAGFEIETIRHHEILGYFCSLFNKWFLPKKNMSISAVKIYDSVFVPLTNSIEKFIPVPFGKSIYLCAVKKN